MLSRSAMAIVAFTQLMVGSAIAQHPGVARYDVDQGLPQSMVNHVVQDSLGFIWFGTGDGLARFDGTRYSVFKHDLQDTTSLSNNAIWSITALDDGDLLVGTGTGLDRYDAHTARFSHLRTDVAPDGCWQFLRADQGRILFYSPLSATFLTMEGGTMRAFPSGHGPSYALSTDPLGHRIRFHVWPDTLVDLDLVSGTERWTILPPEVTGKVDEVMPMQEGNLILTHDGAWIVNERGTAMPLPAEAGTILRNAPGRKCASRSPEGRLWFAVDNVGAMEVDEQWNVLQLHPLVSAEDRPLRLTSIAFDRQGNCWVGSDGKGAFLIAPQRIKFKRVVPGATPGWAPDSWFVRAFAQWDRDRVLIAFHQGGAALFDERSGRLSPLDVSAIIGTALPDRTISRVINDEHGLLWLKIGTEVIVLNTVNSKVIDRMDVMGGAFLLNVPQGGILIAQGRGIRRASIKHDRIHLEPLNYPGLQTALVNQVDRLAADATGQLWSSYVNSGVRVWTAEGERPLGGGWEILARAGPKLGAVVPLQHGRLLITSNLGLLEVDPDTHALLRIHTRHDGLPDDHIYGVLLEGDSAWWISTNNGLCRARIEEGRGLLDVRIFSTKDGLQSKEFNGQAWFRSASGRYYFGGINGFNHFVPEEVHDDPDRPLVRATRLWNDTGDLLLQASGSTRIELPYPRNEMNLELAVLEFSAPERNTFKWRMSGYRDAWTTAAAGTPITLNNVPPGTFTLEVIGMNADGVQGATQELLTVVVVRPFWASPWAMVLSGLFLVLLITWVWMRTYRRRMQRKLAEAERETRELRMRMRLARDIHDDVGSGLARMTALARSPKREQDSAERFEKLGDISGELLENLRDVVWLNDPRHGTLDALLIRIREHASDLFEDTDAALVFDLPEPLPQRPINGTFRRNLFLIAKEALHNTRKYSGAKTIQVRWVEDTDGFIFEVADDGRGIGTAAPQGGGHGTDNMRQRAEELGAHYERNSTPGRGTTVRVQGRSLHLDE